MDLREHGADAVWFVWRSFPPPAKRQSPNGFCDFLDALGDATVRVRIANDPDPHYTRAQLEQPACKRKRADAATIPSDHEDHHSKVGLDAPTEGPTKRRHRRGHKR